MDNPCFANVMRPAHEIPYLFRRLGAITSAGPVTVEQRDLARAADRHAVNAVETLLHGIEAIGNLLNRAGSIGMGMEGGDLGALGDMVSHMAVEVQFLLEVQDEMTCFLEAGSK